MNYVKLERINLPGTMINKRSRLAKGLADYLI